MQSLDLARLEAHRILMPAAIRVARGIVDPHLVQAWLQRLDLGQVLQDGAMLHPRHGGGDEDAEVADVWVGEIDDALSRSLERVRALVDGGNPAQRLVRRRDVVP